MAYFISLRCLLLSRQRLGRRTSKVIALAMPVSPNLIIYIAQGWSCIQHVFETPHGTLMGQKFLGDLLGALNSWDWGDAQSL